MSGFQMPADARERADLFRTRYAAVREQLGKVIVGHADVVDTVLRAFFAGGNVLLEGVPGLGKTMLVRTLSAAMHLEFARIQFTPDLMPADVVGTTIVSEDESGQRQLVFQRGPIFANIVLADEVNRATPKTQSAMLEAMQEQSVTVGGETRQLPNPFLVIATQNPIDMEGTYPLPEAQLDRFMFKIIVGYPQESDYATILQRTTGKSPPEVSSVTTADELIKMRDLVRDVPVPDIARDAAVRLVMATQPGSEYATERVNRYVMLGSSPRGAQALILAGKVAALRDGRYSVSTDDVKSRAMEALRHRMLLNFEGLGEGLKPDDLIGEILETLR